MVRYMPKNLDFIENKCETNNCTVANKLIFAYPAVKNSIEKSCHVFISVKYQMLHLECS